jgi:hypothetical protein
MENKVEPKKVRMPTGPAVVILSGKQRAENDHDAILTAVMAGRQNRHGLVLVFRGEGVLDAFPALELCDRLKELKAEGKEVVTMAECWLGAPDLLVWLQGTTRLMTDCGYGHIKVPTFSRHHDRRMKTGKGKFAKSLPELDSPDEEEAEAHREKRMNNPMGYAYEQMLERLNEYLPVMDYENRVVPRADLVEMGLISHEGLDRSLAKGWPGETEMAEPDDQICRREKQPTQEE